MSETNDLPKVNWDEPRHSSSEGDLAHRIAQQIRQLPEFHRKVLALRYLEGLRLNEIAEAAGVCQSLVTQVHNHALCSVLSACPTRLPVTLRKAANG